MDVNESKERYFMYRVSQKLHSPFETLSLSVPVAAPTFWYIVAYIHDNMSAFMCQIH